ncbi:MAG: hypothetical protein QG567_2264 [Campylobacterota bacterium]|nr:hypothetical protein [Campylobacterota bacterium]
MNRALFLWLFFISLLFAIPDGYFAKEEEVVLKKDEVALYEASGNKFFFRWTLYVNNGLVMHYNYDGFPYQNILYKKHKLNSFKIPLKRGFDNHMQAPYIMVVFKEFREKEAYFTVYLYDPMKSIKLKRE